MVSVYNGCGYFNYVIFSDYGYKHANGIDGPCIRDNTITLPNRNYHAVPSEEHFAFRNEHEGRLVGKYL